MDWIVHGMAKSRTQLSNFHFPWKTKEERKSFLFTLVSVGEGRCSPAVKGTEKLALLHMQIQVTQGGHHPGRTKRGEEHSPR